MRMCISVTACEGCIFSINGVCGLCACVCSPQSPDVDCGCVLLVLKDALWRSVKSGGDVCTVLFRSKHFCRACQGMVTSQTAYHTCPAAYVSARLIICLSPLTCLPRFINLHAALPKSHSTSLPVAGMTSTFCGFKSRWQMSRPWMCARALASW